MTILNNLPQFKINGIVNILKLKKNCPLVFFFIYLKNYSKLPINQGDHWLGNLAKSKILVTTKGIKITVKKPGKRVIHKSLIHHH